MMQSAMLAGVASGIALALDIEIGFIDRLLATPIPRCGDRHRPADGDGRDGPAAARSASWRSGFIFGADVEAGVLGVLLILRARSARVRWRSDRSARRSPCGPGKASVVQGIFPLVFVVVFLSSAFFPRDLLLEPAGSIADWNPMSFIAEGVREPVIDRHRRRARDRPGARSRSRSSERSARPLCALGFRRRLRA